MNILEIKNLSIGFKNNIFQNINAELKAGSLVALMGVNGAGKSCFLKTIAHLIDPKSGQILVSGKNIQDYSALEFAQVTSVVLTEKFHVDFLKVDELVALGRSPYTNHLGKLQKNDLQEIQNVIQETGIESIQEKYFAELSDGQKQKVLIARALAQKPSLLILDEPTTYLDIPSKIELIKLLKKIAKENKVAIIMSTHDMELIENEVDQIWLMGADGSFSIGSPTDLKSAGLIKKHFYFNDLRFEQE